METLKSDIGKQASEILVDLICQTVVQDYVVEKIIDNNPDLQYYQKEQIAQILTDYVREDIIKYQPGFNVIILMINNINAGVNPEIMKKIPEIEKTIFGMKPEVNKLRDTFSQSSKQLTNQVVNLGNQVSGFQTQLIGLEDRITERVKGSLVTELQKIGKLESNIENINNKIPSYLPGRKEFWGGIVTGIGAVGITLLILNSKIDSVTSNSQKVNESQINSLMTQISNLSDTISKAEKDIKEDTNRIEKKVDQVLSLPVR